MNNVLFVQFYVSIFKTYTTCARFPTNRDTYSIEYITRLNAFCISVSDFNFPWDSFFNLFELKYKYFFLIVFTKLSIDPLNSNHRKWSNTLKQIVGKSR